MFPVVRYWAEKPREPGIFQSLLHSFYIATYSLVRSNLAGADIVIEPDLPQVGYGDFHRIGNAVAQGEIAAQEMVEDWLLTGMLKGKRNKKAKARTIIKELSDHALTKSHARHLSASKCKSIGLNVEFLEKDNDLQDAVLTVHHALIHTLSSTAAYKIIENHEGKAFINIANIKMVSK